MLNSDTNDVTVNGVNVIVDKPKRGDVMCVKNGQVVWIDGLSINPEQLSSEIDPVGICMVVDGNKAIVRYKEIRGGDSDNVGKLIDLSYFDATHINSYAQTVSYFYLNNGFKMSNAYGMVLRNSSSYFAYYGNTGISYVKSYNVCLRQMLDVNYNEIHISWPEGEAYWPVSKELFEHSSYCQILRNTYDSYDEYLYSKMIMCPCGKGGAITEQPSGKENTYKLAKLKSTNGDIISPASYWCSYINVDAPNLGAGNWWIPSLAELLQIKYEFVNSSHKVSTGVSHDIVYKVLNKLKKVWVNGVSVLDASMLDDCLTSTIFTEPEPNLGSHPYYCANYGDTLLFYSMTEYGYNLYSYVYPITVYEF